jgi:hypothetical protein
MVASKYGKQPSIKPFQPTTRPSGAYAICWGCDIHILDRIGFGSTPPPPTPSASNDECMSGGCTPRLAAPGRVATTIESLMAGKLSYPPISNEQR